MKMRKVIPMFALATLALFYFGTAQANTVTGSLWHVSDATARDATPGNVPGTPPDATFSVNSPLNFDSRTDPVNGYTVGGWLNTGGAFGVVPNTPGILSSTFNDTIVNFIGQVTVTDGQTFTVEHDDGLTLTIGGLLVVDVPGPTSPTTTTVTYSGPSGTFPFQLVYGECCGAPAVLEVGLPLSRVPEPTTMLLLGFGLLGLWGARKKFKK